MSRIFKMTLVLLVFLLGLALHLKNNHFVHFEYYLGSIDLPLSFMLVLALIVGAVLGIFACFPWLIALQRDNARLSRQARLAEREIDNLRVIPVRDIH